MNFWKTFLACLAAIFVGSIISAIFSFLVLVGVLGVMLSGAKEEVFVKPNSILHINLSNTIRDTPPENPFEDFDFKNFSIKSSLTTLKAVEAIKAAAEDPNIKGIYIDIPMVADVSANVLYELREAIKYFRETSGKFVVAYADYYSQGTYWLAAGSDKILMNPQGALSWSGMSANVMFFKKTLDKLGIEPEIFRHGKFKSAIEPFMLDKMSDENRAQMNSLLASMWGYIVSDIADDRNIDSALLQKYASDITVTSPQVAAQLKFVDTTCYRDYALTYLGQLTQTPEDRDPSLISLSNYASTVSPNAATADQVAVLYAVGDIIDAGGDGTQAIVGNKLRDQIVKLRRNKNVKAIVLRVNSPGGSVLASDIIYNEMKLLRDQKPVVVSMGDYAASGGYYISCPADEIITAPNTITGSIGVFGLWFNVQKGAADILGVNVDVAKTNVSADMGNIFRPLTPAERLFMQNGVDTVYNRFVGLVANGRQMTFDQVDSIAEGRVWSGNQAVKLKLADRIGTLTDAIEAAAQKAGLTEYKIATYPKENLDSFSALIANSLSSLVSYKQLDPTGQAKQQLKTLQQKQGIMARIPFDVEIK